MYVTGHEIIQCIQFGRLLHSISWKIIWFLKLHAIWIRVGVCELNTISSPPLPTPDWFVFKLALGFFSSAGWHQFHFPSFLVSCYYAFKNLMNIARLCRASCRYVKWTHMERGVSQFHVSYRPINPGVCVCTYPRFRAGGWLTPFQEVPGLPWLSLSLHRWTDESLVLSQGNLSVCPVWGRPAAWPEEEPGIGANGSRNQTGSRLRQQNGNRYCLACCRAEDVVFSKSFYLFFKSGQGRHCVGLGWGSLMVQKSTCEDVLPVVLCRILRVPCSSLGPQGPAAKVLMSPVPCGSCWEIDDVF